MSVHLRTNRHIYQGPERDMPPAADVRTWEDMGRNVRPSDMTPISAKSGRIDGPGTTPLSRTCSICVAPFTLRPRCSPPPLRLQIVFRKNDIFPRVVTLTVGIRPPYCKHAPTEPTVMVDKRQVVLL